MWKCCFVHSLHKSFIVFLWGICTKTASWKWNITFLVLQLSTSGCISTTTSRQTLWLVFARTAQVFLITLTRSTSVSLEDNPGGHGTPNVELSHINVINYTSASAAMTCQNKRLILTVWIAPGGNNIINDSGLAFVPIVFKMMQTQTSTGLWFIIKSLFMLLNCPNGLLDVGFFY